MPERLIGPVLTPQGTALELLRRTLWDHQSADREWRVGTQIQAGCLDRNNRHFFFLSLDERPWRAADLPQRPLARWICIRPSLARAAPSPLHPPPFVPSFALSCRRTFPPPSRSPLLPLSLSSSRSATLCRLPFPIP